LRSNFKIDRAHCYHIHESPSAAFLQAIPSLGYYIYSPGNRLSNALSWFSGQWIVWALSLVMLGMGFTLSVQDFRGILRMPVPVVIGEQNSRSRTFTEIHKIMIFM
jgi:hypothetical protein